MTAPIPAAIERVGGYPGALARARWTHLGSYHALLALCTELDASDDRAFIDAIAEHVGIDAADGFKAKYLAILLVRRETYDGAKFIPNYSTSREPLYQATWGAEVYLDGVADELLDELRDAVAEARKVEMKVAA